LRDPDAYCIELARCAQAFPGLRELYFLKCDIGAAGMAALAQAPLPTLATLQVGSCSSVDAAAALAAGPSQPCSSSTLLLAESMTVGQRP
jgi:hypothetical protein